MFKITHGDYCNFKNPTSIYIQIADSPRYIALFIYYNSKPNMHVFIIRTI